jgi:hypothetical protein
LLANNVPKKKHLKAGEVSSRNYLILFAKCGLQVENLKSSGNWTLACSFEAGPNRIRQGESKVYGT